MTGRKLLIALTAALLFAGVVATSASAQLHQARVTLITGQVMVVTVDVPPGGSVASSLPALPAPVQSVVDLGPVSTPTPVPTPQVPTPSAPSVPDTPSVPSAPGGTGGGGQSSGGGGGGTITGGGGSTGSPQSGRVPSKSGGGNTESLTGKVKRTVEKTKRRAAHRRNAVRAPDGTPTLNNP